MTDRVYVYVAGPMRLQIERGVHSACMMGDRLLAEGFIPFLPQVHVLWTIISPPGDGDDDAIYNSRLPFDFAWLDKCDVLLRLPGKSVGADLEIEHALKMNKPVFYNIVELLEWRTKRDKWAKM